MRNALVDVNALPTNKYNDEKTCSELVTATTYLKRMQLYTASSAAITSGFIGSGRFGVPLAKDKIEDLGNSVDCLPVAWRFKAMKFGEAVISVYNPQSKQFKDIQNTADEVPDSGCSYGLEFLVWLPSLKQFVTYFMNSKTS